MNIGNHQKAGIVQNAHLKIKNKYPDVQIVDTVLQIGHVINVKILIKNMQTFVPNVNYQDKNHILK